MRRATIRKRDGAWTLTWQPYGFGMPRQRRFSSHSEAIAALRQGSVAGAMPAGTEISPNPIGEIVVRRMT